MLWKLRHIASKYVPWRPVQALRALKIGLATRRVIERSKKSGTSPKDWFLGIDDETWFWMNMADRAKVHHNVHRGCKICPLPRPALIEDGIGRRSIKLSKYPIPKVMSYRSNLPF